MSSFRHKLMTNVWFNYRVDFLKDYLNVGFFFFNSVHELVNPKTRAFSTSSTSRLTFIVLSKESKKLKDLLS